MAPENPLKFGNTLVKSIRPGQSIPDIIDQSAYVLQFVMDPAELLVLFDMPINDPSVESLRVRFENWNPVDQESPLAQETNPQAIASLLTLFLRSIPHPLIPPKWFHTFIRLSLKHSEKSKLSQLRILVSKLPEICIQTFNTLLPFLQAITNACPELLPKISNLYAKYILRLSPELPADSIPVPLTMISITSTMIKYADYILMITNDMPELVEVPSQEPDFKLEAVALFDYAGGDGQAAFKKGDRFQLSQAFPENWMQGNLKGTAEDTFIPGAYLDIIPFVPKVVTPPVISSPKQPLVEKNGSTIAMPPPPPPPPKPEHEQEVQQQKVPEEEKKKTEEKKLVSEEKVEQRRSSDVELKKNPIDPVDFNKMKYSQKRSNSGSIVKDCKVVVVGSGGVGKSALTIRFLQNVFVKDYDPTIEDSYRKQFEVDGDQILLSILDTAGQEEFSAMRDEYMRGGQGFLLVFSLTSRGTFDELDSLKEKILQVKDTNSIPIVLAANKKDLVDLYEVTIAEAEAKAAKYGIPFYATSAKDRVNVDEVFAQLVRDIRKDIMSKKPEGATKKKKKAACIVL